MLQIPVNSHIILKQIELLDAYDMFRTIDTQRHYLRRWLPFIDTTLCLEDSMDFIQDIYQSEEGAHELVFVIQYDGEFAGLIGFKDTDLQNRSTEIGYWLSEGFQKKGIMTQSVITLVDFAFDRLEVDRVLIRCATGNEPSKKIPQRVHFKLQGIEKDGELLSDGNYTDLEVYSMHRDDFQYDGNTK